jgi:hypothetical protein
MFPNLVELWHGKLLRQRGDANNMIIMQPTSQYLQNIVATGSSSGNMWILKLEPTGRSNLVNQIKLHSGGLDQV